MGKIEYCVWARYQMWAKEGIVWTNWFLDEVFITANDAEKYMEDKKEISKMFDKKTKLNHEYKIIESKE